MLATPRLLLIPATAETMELAAKHHLEELSRALKARVPTDWPPRLDDD